MPFPNLPFLGQQVDLEINNKISTGILHSIGRSHCEIEISGEISRHPVSSIKSARFHFPTYFDAMHHLSKSGESRHCERCYISVLYAVDLLGINFKHQAFSSREDIIKRAVISYLQKDFPTTAYSLFPQVDGITTQLLSEDGLLKITKGFPKWTLEHPDSSFHGKSCSNLIKSLEGAKVAGDNSKIQHVSGWLGQKVIEDIKQLRNNLTHGSLLQVDEHQASMLILLLQALHHGVSEHLKNS